MYFTCSFDDGDTSDKRLAILMQKYGIKGTFYIPKYCELAKKNLNEAEIREISNYIEVGAHTINHPVLTQIEDSLAKIEIINSKNWLEAVIGKEVKCFCPPTGRFNNFHKLVTKEAGYSLIRTVEMLQFSNFDITDNSIFTILPTTFQCYNHSQKSYFKNAIKRMNFSKVIELQKVYNKSWLQMAINYINFVIQKEKSMNEKNLFIHLWGHSWELDKYNLWDELESFFMMLSNIDEINLKFCTNSELVLAIQENG